MTNSLVLNTRSTGAELEYKKIFSNSSCKLANSFFVWLIAKEFLGSFIAIHAHCNRNYHTVSAECMSSKIFKDWSPKTRTCKLFLEDEDFPRGQQHSRDLAIVHATLRCVTYVLWRNVYWCKRALHTLHNSLSLVRVQTDEHTHILQWLLEYETGDFWTTLKLRCAFPVSR